MRRILLIFILISLQGIKYTRGQNLSKSLSYLALGDSYTIGEHVGEKDSFPYQLHTRLAGAGLQKPIIIAQTGWTTDDLIAAINSSGLGNKNYDIVTLLIGVNDQFQGLSPEQYRANFIRLLSTAISFAKNNRKHVFVISIPDYGVTPFAEGHEAEIGPAIDLFNKINRQESAKAGVNYVDITPTSKKAAADNALVASDGLHPSAQMYQLWVDKLAPVVSLQLK